MAPALGQAAIFFLLEIAFCTVGFVLAFVGDSISVGCLGFFAAGFLFGGGGTETTSACVRKSNSPSRGRLTCPVLNECVVANSLTEHYRRHTIFGRADGSRANRRKCVMTLELTCGYPHEFRTIPFCFRNSPDGGPKSVLRKAAKSRKITGVRCLSRTHKFQRHHLRMIQEYPPLPMLVYRGTHISPHSEGDF